MLLYRSDPAHLSCNLETPSRLRDWMNPHAYRCLPLAVANELGLDIICPMDVTYEWDGKEDKAAVQVSEGAEIAASHFGSGSITFTLGYIWKLPKQVKKQLLFIPVPNDFDPRFTAMSALIEPAALTYPIFLTLKLTKQGTQTIEKGTRLGRVMVIDVEDTYKFPVKIIDKAPKHIATDHKKSKQIRLEHIEEHREDKNPDKRLWTRFYFDKAKYKKLKIKIIGG
ncbi:MAG: DUF6065 family protein [Rickettsiales bacterium]|nr:DUF6065 family protein [Rickettsiales bacterium]